MLNRPASAGVGFGLWASAGKRTNPVAAAEAARKVTAAA